MEDLQYIVSCDSRGNPLEGDWNYQFHLPSDMPAANFWSVIVYDNQSQLIIQSGQSWPSVHSNSKKLVLNPDNSVDVWFGPEAPEGKSGNWIQTIPEKEWYVVLRIYDLREDLTWKTWMPDQIEKVN
jgi:hypothetical protein